MTRILFLFLTLLSFNADAFRIRGPFQVAIGPEIYYLHRSVEGGSVQNGTMVGPSFKFERFRRCALFWSAQYTAAWGKLIGNNGSGSSLRSTMCEQQAEGRLGYNYQWKTGYKPYILPFIGYGYLRQANEFQEPAVTLVDYFPYSSFGLQLGMNLSCYTSIGLLVKGDWMLEGNSFIEISGNPDRIERNMEEKWQYTVELPLTHRKSLGRRCFYWVFTPFVRLRHLGGLPGFPANFPDTRYSNYGARFMLAYDF